MGEDVAAPCPPQDRQGLVHAGGAIVERHGQRVELLLQPSRADAEEESAAGGILQGEGHAGRHQRVTEGQDEDPGRQAQLGGDAGARGEGDEGVEQLGRRVDDRAGVVLMGGVAGRRVLAPVLRWQHDVLSEPQRFESGGVGRRRRAGRGQRRRCRRRTARRGGSSRAPARCRRRSAAWVSGTGVVVRRPVLDGVVAVDRCCAVDSCQSFQSLTLGRDVPSDGSGQRAIDVIATR